MIGRRRVLALGGAIIGGALLQKGAFALSAGVGDTLKPWSPGHLDIHHIDTGRGNATFILGPDGTTMLIDCGTSNNGLDVSAPPRPDSSRTPGTWVARYALRHARAAGRTTLDYIIATHIHPDHVGDIRPGDRVGPRGFVPTGLSEVDGLMPAATVIDRSFPDYGALPPLNAPFAQNYLAWLKERVVSGRRVESISVGSDRQIQLRSAASYPEFSVRAIAANGRVWTGDGNASSSIFPDVTKLPAGQRPTENACSIALRLQHGRFAYFTGGDLNADTHDGRAPWGDIETPAARAAGRVEVAVADHHGYFDAVGAEFVKALDAQAYIIPSWHISHPGQAQVERMIGAWPGETPRDVFALELLPQNRVLNERFVGRLKSAQGHVVVRVAPKGDSYQIFVIDSGNERDTVLGIFGPYACRT